MASVTPIEFILWCALVVFLDAAVGPAALRHAASIAIQVTCIGAVLYCLRGRHSRT